MNKLSTSIREKADKLGAAMIEHLKVTSVQYAVMYKGEIVLSGATGSFDKEESRALDKDVMYGIGSVSKVYVTAAAMLLVDKKQLDIDKPLVEYIPDFEMADERYVKITPRHLMNHASGIYGTHFKRSFAFEETDTYAHDNLLDNLKKCSLKFEPGLFSEYCNDGFQILEILVERVSGMGYTEFLNKFFFEPLGIKNTKTPIDIEDLSRMARFYAPFYDGPLPREITNLLGTGGIISTAEDMCVFGQVLTGKKILSEVSTKAMAEKEYERGAFWPKDEEQYNLFGYGLGWDHVHQPPFDKLGIQALVKGGDTSQYHASLICLPEHDMIAAAASSGGVSITNCLLATMLLQEALKEYGITKEIIPAPTFEAPAKADMPPELLKYEGLYAANGKFVEIKIKDGEIKFPELVPGFVPAQTVSYAGDGLFKNADGSISIKFSEQPGGLTFVQGDVGLQFPGVGVMMWKAFLFQRLDTNPVSAQAAAAWEKRNGKKYFAISDKYNSPSFMTAPVPMATNNDGFPVNTEIGYAYGGCRIIDENSAKNVLYFREVADLRFETKNGAEYLYAKDGVFISEDSIPELNVCEASVKIDADGFARYFWIGEGAAKKTVTVKLPKDTAFAVYNDKLEYKNLSTVSGKNTTSLDKGDLIAFIGTAGNVFEISFTDTPS